MMPYETIVECFKREVLNDSLEMGRKRSLALYAGIRELEAERDALRADNARLTADNQRLREEIAALNAQLRQLGAPTLEELLADAELEVASLTGRIARARAEAGLPPLGAPEPAKGIGE